MSARRHRLAATLRRSVVTASAGAVLCVSVASATPTVVEVDPGPTAEAPRAPAVDPVAALMEAHACWSGGQHDDVIPGHAVVTLPGERPELVPAEVGFRIWLEGDPGRLHGFCP